MKISIKNTLQDEIRLLPFNIEIYRNKNKVEYYARLENKLYDLYVERVYTLRDIELECTEGV